MSFSDAAAAAEAAEGGKAEEDSKRSSSGGGIIMLIPLSYIYKTERKLFFKIKFIEWPFTYKYTDLNSALNWF